MKIVEGKVPRDQDKKLPVKKKYLKGGKYFKNLFWSSPEIIDKSYEEILHDFLDINLGNFMEDELNIVLKTTQNIKAAGFNKILSEVWKTRNFDNIFHRLCNAVYKQNTIEKCLIGPIHFLKK